MTPNVSAYIGTGGDVDAAQVTVKASHNMTGSGGAYSTAEAAGELTLTLNEPLRYAQVSDPVTLTPGCDGRPGTCQVKS